MKAHKSGDLVPHGTPDPPVSPGLLRSLLDTLGHLAIWAVLYAIGVALMLGTLLSMPLQAMGILYIALCANAGYLFDRIKFRNADLDPADLLADPPRHLFLRKHARSVRSMMWIDWILAAVVGYLIHPLLALFVLAGVLAGYLYSGWRPGAGSRLKDISGIKALVVACAVVGLGVVTVLESSVGLDPQSLRSVVGVWSSSGGFFTIAGVWLIVCADAIICDLDDLTSDGMYKTQSLPVMMGSRRAGMVAAGMLLLGASLIVYAGVGNPDLTRRTLLGGTLFISGVGIMRQSRRRDWIDARMLVLVVLAIVLTG